MRTISAIRIATALAVMLLGAASAVAAQPAPAADAEVEIDQFAFVPQRITVKAGTDRDLDQRGRRPTHRRLEQQALQVEGARHRDKFSFTFTTPGTYAYFCSVHPHMTGTVVVEAASGADAAQ